MKPSASNAQLTIIFITVFLYLVGFGIVIPILPILSRDFGATATQTGLLLAAYSLMQFLFAPFWGRLSDRLGRRPILLFCLLGEGLSFLLFAYSKSLEGLFVARILAGFFSASISTASAYIADITSIHERSKGMSLIGVAFGLGFIIGPSLGGGLSVWGASIDPSPHFATSFAFSVVAALCFANFLFGLKFLKESLVHKNTNLNRKKRWSEIYHYLKVKTVGPLMIVLFLTSFAMSGMEASLILLMNEKFEWGLVQVSLGFAHLGLVSVLTQGLLLRRLLSKWGERKVLRLGIFLLAVGITGIAFSENTVSVFITMTLLALGNGLTNPSALGSISLLTGANEQGSTMGVTQGLASLGRVIGPILGGFLYQRLSMTSPFLGAGFLVFLGFVIVVLISKAIPESGKQVV